MKWEVVLAVAITATLSSGQNDDIDFEYVGDFWTPLDVISQPVPEVVTEAPLPCPHPNDYVDPFEIYDSDRYNEAPPPVFSHVLSTPCPTDITSKPFFTTRYPTSMPQPCSTTTTAPPTTPIATPQPYTTTTSNPLTTTSPTSTPRPCTTTTTTPPTTTTPTPKPCTTGDAIPTTTLSSTAVVSILDEPTATPAQTNSTSTPPPVTNQPSHGLPIQFCTLNNKILSEYYDALYVDVVRGNDNEKFFYDTLTQTIRSKINGKYLGADSGDHVRLEPWSGAASQQWILDNKQLKNVGSQKVLTFDHSLPGSNPTLSLPAGRVSQFFDICDEESAPRNLVKLVTVNNNYVSEYYGGLYVDREFDNFNELFEFDGRLFKSVSAFNQCLDAYDSGNGNYKLHTFECSVDNRNQQWVVDAAGHRVKHAVHPNLCLDIDPTNGNKAVQVWECHNWNTNQWVDVVKY